MEIKKIHCEVCQEKTNFYIEVLEVRIRTVLYEVQCAECGNTYDVTKPVPTLPGQEELSIKVHLGDQTN